MSQLSVPHPSAGIGSGAQVIVSAGGTDIGGTVNSGGQLSVLGGGKASGTTVIGLEVVSAGGVVVSATVENNGTLGGFSSGLGVFGIASRTLVGTDGQEAIFSGGTDIRGTVSGGGQLVVGLLGGGLALSTTVLSGGREFILSGGTGIFATLVGNDASPATFAAEVVNSGGRVSRTVVSSGGVLIVSAGGLAVSTTVNSTGIGFDRAALALSGGTASNTTINSAGQEGIFAGGTNIGATWGPIRSQRPRQPHHAQRRSGSCLCRRPDRFNDCRECRELWLQRRACQFRRNRQRNCHQ